MVGTSKYAKRNFPSCSLRSQFTASQKPPLLFPNAKKLEPATGNQQMGTIFPPPLAHFICNSLPRCGPQCKWEPLNENHKMGTIFPHPLAHFIRNSLPHCAPQCKSSGNHWVNHISSPSCSLRSQFTASLRSPML